MTIRLRAAAFCLVPLLLVATNEGAAGGYRGMPDLSGLSLRTDPQVYAEGRIIKGLYYATEPDGQNDLVAFFNACSRRLEGRPFLIVDFGTQRYYFDADRDGRLDETGASKDSIDPVPFAQRAADWNTYCYGDGSGQAL